ncbi:MAG: DNA repair protein RecN [Lachnospiraceae bacterium]|uniref:DNA repair protein RecN n=1 Tax=Candidatus Weimeria bifida TaxID=2599074 RepID=A0A6N7J3R9_9FIRM|nr:DNA repair protein RecN [Candidatus Weimeria bifida]RRF96188.1 MAG: DNA repair protein RecN [Lachnospiraceae bacterium]
MLESLRVENLALIEKEEIEFAEGLNVLTGETGAGKSIILGALDLALGGKADRRMVRDPERDAYVEAVFSLDESEEERLRAADFEPEDGQLIFSRKIKGAKSQARLNGETVPAARLKKAGELLLDIYGQNEHQSLSDPKKHLPLLDEFVKKDLNPVLEKLAPVYKKYTSIRKKLSEADIDESQRKRDISYYSHVSEEIEDAGLKPGEDEELEAKNKKMAGSEKVAQNLSDVQNLLFGEEDVLSLIGESQRNLASIADYDDSVADLGKTLGDAYDILENFSHELIGAAENLTFDPAEFDQVTRRLDLINDLKQKYGRTIEDIFKTKEEADEKLEQLNDHENYVAGLKKELADASNDLNDLCEKAENIRKNGAKVLEEKVKESLKNLNFLKADFEVEISRTSYSAGGFNAGQFLISTNPGESLKPLSQVASGGEMSRIMLALKTVLASADDIKTMIFDEIDTGISGRTASAVARELKKVSAGRQVILITHLPQIAALSDRHFLIEKSATNDSTVSSIRPLNEDEITDELARMIGGDVITDAVRESARELREKAE